MTRILLVEGNEADALRMGETLRGRPDWEVVRAATLLEAIRAAGDAPFDAAILDTHLPDGSGLEILDFLRIGSPNIRILLCADRPSESVAFHALSHGAGDLLVKDPHLETELPRRIDALLIDPAGALVETLAPVSTYDSVTFTPPPTQAEGASVIDALLDDVVTDSVLAAGVWDLRGHPIAVKLPKDLDGAGVGFAMATLHGQVGSLWTYGNLKPTGYRLVIDVEGGLLAITAIPGTFIVALLFDGGFPPRRALERVDQVGLRVLATLQGASGADDLPGP